MSHKLCVVCYEKSISLAILAFRPKNEVKERFSFFFFRSNGIIILKKHVDANHFLIAINFEE
jgi:hypothetical protein